MRAKSFQLEERFPVTFLLQGWLGGALAAFVYTVAICFADQYVDFFNAVVCLLFLTPFGYMLGITKSALMWAPYRFAKFQPRAITRVVLTSIATGVFAFVIGRLYSDDPRNWVPWVAVLLLGGLPTAILVGSNVKPWELFTFGSIGGERIRTVWGTLGTLPLRFLSLCALALWILYLACQRGINWSLDLILFFALPAIYLILSAAVTFRSPRKVTLFVIGVCVQIPVAIVAFFPHAVRPAEFQEHDISLVVMAICGVFLIAWTIFLVARLTVRTQRVPLINMDEVVLKNLCERDHDCLGSRFLEWQQRAA